VSHVLWSEPFGPFIFGFESSEEVLQSYFWFNTSCVSYKRRWTVEQGKETEMGCGKGQRNTSEPKVVTKEQEIM
jgi:hypothetical protein